MASKVTCSNCGWSWNKSDSSKKDMYVCHQCGRDNSNKSESWLDKYYDGGTMQEHQENYNIYDASAPEGMQGDGFSNIGRDYSPAWGGQFQKGGFLQPNDYRLPSGIAIPNRADIISSELATSIGGEDGEPAYLIPSFKGGRRVNALEEYKKTGEHLGGPFKTYQEAEEWERDIRHPYVEKGQSIPTPIRSWGKDFQMGGSLPGSVGFTYARTAGSAPANGKYTKKTKASAQKGKSLFKAPDVPTYTQGKESTAIAQPIIPLSDVDISRNKFYNEARRARETKNPIINALEYAVTPIKKLAKEELSSLGENLDPFAYSTPGEKGVVSAKERILNSGIFGSKEESRKQLEKRIKTDKENPDNQEGMTRIDLLQLYAGKPQQYSTLEPSDYVPTAGHKRGEEYVKSKFVEDALINQILTQSDTTIPIPNLRTKADVQRYIETHGETALDVKPGAKTKGIATKVPALGTATLSAGEEGGRPYLSYSDLWDLNPYTGAYADTPEKEQQNWHNQLRKEEVDIATKFAGAKPPKVYGRIYFDPKTGRPIQKEDGGEISQAQNGVSAYYQHGLDFKTKGMKDGGWLDSYDVPQAQEGDMFLKREPIRPARESVSIMRNIPGEGPSTTATTGQRKEDVKLDTEGMARFKTAETKDKQKRVAERKSAVAAHDKGKPFTLPTGETKKYEDMDWREKAYVSGKSLESKGRTNEDDEAWYDDYLSPVNWITSSAGELATAPLEARESNSNLPYLSAIAIPLAQGALGFDPLGEVMKFAKNPTKNIAKTLIDIPRAENIKEAMGRVAGVPLKKDIPRMGIEDVKALRQVQELGRLNKLGASKSDQIKYALENNLPEEHFFKVFNKSKEHAQDQLTELAGQEAEQSVRSADIRSRLLDRLDRPRNRSSRFEPVDMTPEEIAESEASMDGFLAVGSYSPMQDRTLSRSDLIQSLIDDGLDAAQRDYETELLEGEAQEAMGRFSEFLEPSDGMSSSKGGLKSSLHKLKLPLDKNKLKSSLENFAYNNIQDYPYSANFTERVPNLHLTKASNSGNTTALKNVHGKVWRNQEGITSGDVFTGSTNTSHSSYLPQLKQVFKYTKGDPQFLGYQPMNSMGFLSDYRYSHDDIAKYLNSEIDEQVKRGVIPKNIQRPFTKGESVILPHYGIKQHKEGGIVKDDMGYWNPDNHGKVVEIGSNNITMEGVDQPLIGISDEGDKKYMLPGKNYKFKGKKVREYPVAKNGVRQEQKGLLNLDQLTNFTNYNKPQPGGWLNKYN